jgi:Protein of unknown function (DUF1552)
MNTRRRLLLGAGGAALALPFLESLGRAQSANVPTRLVILTTGEGTLLSRWTPPALANNGLQLSQLLQPLAPHQASLNVVSGVSNEVAGMLNGQGAHNVPGHTLLSAHVCDDSVVTFSSLSMGPSIDAAVAAALGVRPLNLCVNGPDVGEYQMFYTTNPQSPSSPSGPRAPATLESDPASVFDRLLAPLVPAGGAASTPPPTTLKQRLERQRPRVLDGLTSSLTRLSSRVSAADRRVLEAHAQRIRELSEQLAVPTTPGTPAETCAPTAPGALGSSVDAAYRATIDVMVEALACGVTRVATLQDTSYDSPRFQDLVPPSADLTRRGAVALSAPVSGWHQQIHGEQGGSPNENPSIAAGFLFYAAQMRYLLDRMASITEANGRTLLDNSLVVWVSEFGDGATHNPSNLPFVLAGSMQGALRTGRHLARSGYSTNDMFTSILRLFGQPATTFGSTADSSLNRGGIPDIG